MIPIPVAYKALGVVVLAASLVAYGHHLGYQGEHDKFVAFKAQVKVLGEAAQKAAIKQVAADKVKKENADHENQITIAGLRTDVKRMRDSRASSHYVPSTTSSTQRPDLACFDRAELESAIRIFDLGVQGLVDKGSEATINLNTAKAWAK